MPVKGWFVSGLLAFAAVTVGWFVVALVPTGELVLPDLATPDLGLDEIEGTSLIGILILLLCSVGVYILHSPTRYAWRHLRTWGWLGLGGIVLWLLTAFSLAQLAFVVVVGVGSYPVMYGIFASMLGLQGIFLGTSVWLVRGQNHGQMGRWLLGELPAMYGVGRGILEYLRAVPWILGAIVINGLLIQLIGWEDLTPTNVDLFFVSEQTWQVVLLVAMVVFLAPLGEELFFRGLLYRNLREWWSPEEAGLASALVFGFIHMEPTTFLPLVVIGYVLARSYERTGSLVVVITMHAVHNGLNLLLILSMS